MGCFALNACSEFAPSTDRQLTICRKCGTIKVERTREHTRLWVPGLVERLWPALSTRCINANAQQGEGIGGRFLLGFWATRANYPCQASSGICHVEILRSGAERPSAQNDRCIICTRVLARRVGIRNQDVLGGYLWNVVHPHLEIVCFHITLTGCVLQHRRRRADSETINRVPVS